MERQQPGRLTGASMAFYVAMAPPGAFGDTVYPESGRQTTNAIATGLSGRGHTARVGDAPEEAEQALDSARSAKADYLVYPVVEHWEERATEWSGIPDRIRVAIRVYESESGRLVDASTVTGTSRWGTLGGDHPQDLLEPGLEPYFNDLFTGGL